jgi:hypothetical protein
MASSAARALGSSESLFRAPTSSTRAFNGARCERKQFRVFGAHVVAEVVGMCIEGYKGGTPRDGAGPMNHCVLEDNNVSHAKQ